MKKNYMQPRVETLKTQSINAFLLTGSNEGDRFLGDGGSARNGGIRNADSKGRGDDNFEDLW